MSRSNYNKPFYVDVGTSVVAIRCASNRDIIVEYDYGRNPPMLNITKDLCDRMNKEAAIGRPLRNCDVGTAEEQEVRFISDRARCVGCDSVCSEGNMRMMIYWLAAATLTACVTFTGGKA